MNVTQHIRKYHQFSNIFLTLKIISIYRINIIVNSKLWEIKAEPLKIFELINCKYVH